MLSMLESWFEESELSEASPGGSDSVLISVGGLNDWSCSIGFWFVIAWLVVWKEGCILPGGLHLAHLPGPALVPLVVLAVCCLSRNYNQLFVKSFTF